MIPEHPETFYNVIIGKKVNNTKLLVGPCYPKDSGMIKNLLKN